MKKAISSLLTLAVLSLTMALTAQASFIDSTDGTYSGAIVFGNAQQAVVFTTGAGGPFTIGDLKLGMRTYNPGSFDFTVGLRAVDGSNNPTGANLSSVVLNTGPLADNAYVGSNNVLDFTALGSLGTYSMAANTQYALVVELGSAPSLGWGAVQGVFPTPDPQYGFTVQKGSDMWTGSSWNQIFGPATSFDMAIGPGAPTTVPEPSTYALLCVGLGVVGYARKKMSKTEPVQDS